MQIKQDTVIPHSNELEELVIGALISYPVSLIDLLPILKPEVFYNTKHQTICQAILNLAIKDAPVDIVTVATELRAIHQLEEIGGSYYLSTLTKDVPASTKVKYHYKKLKELYFRRRMIDISFQTVRKAQELNGDFFDLYDWVTSQLQEIEVHESVGSFLEIGRASCRGRVYIWVVAV